MLTSMNYLFLVFSILLTIFPGNVPAAVVTLHSIHIYKTHELVGKPTVYFKCKGENDTVLPDVKKAKVVYTFNGEESWQFSPCVKMHDLSGSATSVVVPLTKFPSKKCKRCGLYEKDDFPWSHSDIFHEWEFCPSDFTSPDAIYTLVKEKEFDATFSCPACLDLGADPHGAASDKGRKGLSIGIIILISSTATVIVLVGFIGMYRFWKKRKRQQEQLRFMKLFEEQDDLEDELGLGDDL